MKKIIFLSLSLSLSLSSLSWGFWGHQKINGSAVYLLPPSMLVLYKTQLPYLVEHSVDPDKRRYLLPGEGPRHYIDLDRFADWDSIPRNWNKALTQFGNDTLNARGIVPWWIILMKHRLTKAFKEGETAAILKLSAELGHYIADAHVPLHAHSNHNGQLSDQHGIHGFWESRIPELLADEHWNFWLSKAEYLHDPVSFIWQRVYESGKAADSVLRIEKTLSKLFPERVRYSYEPRKGKIIRQYSSKYTEAYNTALNGMVERRMRQSIHAIASFWYTCWVDAGQPELKSEISTEEDSEIQNLNRAWLNRDMIGRKEEE